MIYIFIITVLSLVDLQIKPSIVVYEGVFKKPTQKKILLRTAIKLQANVRTGTRNTLLFRVPYFAIKVRSARVPQRMMWRVACLRQLR